MAASLINHTLSDAQFSSGLLRDRSTAYLQTGLIKRVHLETIAQQ